MPYKNPEEQKAYDRQKYLKNRERILERRKLIHAQNREKENEQSNAYQKRNRTKINSRIRKWRKKRSAAKKAQERQWRKEYNSLHPELRREINRRYYYKNREKVLARQELHLAVKSGQVKRPDHCTRCGLVCTPQGHHADYSKPLEVVWLCDPCHKTVHSEATR